MSVKYSDFQGWVILAVKRFPFYGTINAELNAISTALATDLTTHSEEIENPVSTALQYGNLPNTDFTDEILYLVNKGKAGNLSNATMAQAIDGVTGALAKPGIVDVPYASAAATPPITGTICSVTTGNWVGTPTSYAYQWLHDGVNATGAGATTNSYTVAAADVGGHNLTCVVTATNATGSTAAPPSNAIRVP